MKKTIFICFQNIFPATDGGKKSSLGRVLDSASEVNNSTILICFDLAPGLTENSDSSKSFFNNHNVKYHEAVTKGNPTSLLKFLSLFSLHSYYILHASHKSLRTRIRDIIEREKCEDMTIYCEGVYSFYALPIDLRASAVVIAHNIEFHFFRTLSRTSNSLSKKIFHLITSYKMFFEERWAYKKCLSVAFLNAQEKQFAQSLFGLPEAKLLLAKNVLPPIREQKRQSSITDSFLLFPGSVTFGPNYEAMVWFLKNVFPSILEVYPRLSLVITGSYEPQHLSEFSAYPNVRLSGLVSEEDLHLLYLTCRAVISPIQNGAGIKIKNLEAVQLGAPLVMTKTSASGIIPKQMDQIACEDDSPEKFTEAVLQLLSSKIRESGTSNM